MHLHNSFVRSFNISSNGMLQFPVSASRSFWVWLSFDPRNTPTRLKVWSCHADTTFFTVWYQGTSP